MILSILSDSKRSYGADELLMPQRIIIEALPSVNDQGGIGTLPRVAIATFVYIHQSTYTMVIWTVHLLNVLIK
jgi:hypothetical protein